MIEEIFKDEGIIKKRDLAREERLLFSGIYCDNSLYVFSKKNTIRLYAYKLYKHKSFDNVIMSIIALSSFKLAIDSYLVDFDDSSIPIQISTDVNIFMNVCF